MVRRGDHELEFMDEDEINSCVRWLLGNASPSVRYLTRMHIVHADPRSVPMRTLWKEVENDAEEIFSRQNRDGSWFSGGPWGPRGYRRQAGRGYTSTRPKFVTTAWILPFLGELGFTASDERIRRSCAYMLQEMGSPDHGSDRRSPETDCCGLAAIPLRAFASVGMSMDGRLKAGWQWLASCQRTDGGWLNPNHLADSPTPSTTQGRWPWDRSCAWGSYFAVQALFLSDCPDAERALPASLEFLRGHLLKQDPRHIRTWVYHGHNTVRELLMFSAAGFDMHAEPMRGQLRWLKGYYRPREGLFRTQEKPVPDFVRHASAVMKDFEREHGADYWARISKTSAPVLRYHLYHLIEDDWLTYHMTRIALAMSPDTVLGELNR